MIFLSSFFLWGFPGFLDARFSVWPCLAWTSQQLGMFTITIRRKGIRLSQRCFSIRWSASIMILWMLPFRNRELGGRTQRLPLQRANSNWVVVWVLFCSAGCCWSCSSYSCCYRCSCCWCSLFLSSFLTSFVPSLLPFVPSFLASCKDALIFFIFFEAIAFFIWCKMQSLFLDAIHCNYVGMCRNRGYP